jgi:hypothetical protein
MPMHSPSLLMSGFARKPKELTLYRAAISTNDLTNNYLAFGDVWRKH